MCSPLSVVVLLSVVCFSFPCKDGWRQSAYDSNKCYYVGAIKKDWFDAEIFCQAAAPNAHLTSVAMAFELNNIAAIANETLNDCDSMWIGGNDFDQSGQFVWTDERPFSYSYWAPGQPNPINHCVSWQARLNSQWKSENCGTANCFLCEQYINAIASTTQQSLTTTNTQLLLNMDLVIAIDGSATMPMTSFSQVITFLRTLVIPSYFDSIGQGSPGVRIALVVVPGGNIGNIFPAATLNTVINRAALLGQLDNLNAFYDGTSGQLLNTMLNLVSGIDFLNDGYRQSVNNHLILYITGTSTVTDVGNAQTLAQQIRSSGLYGIITIAYTAEGQPAINQQVLMNIAGANCFMQANTMDQLVQNGLDFVRQRMINASTTGLYC